MTIQDAAQSAVFYLNRLTPRGYQEEQELLHVIQALSMFANSGTNVYTNKSAPTAS